MNRGLYPAPVLNSNQAKGAGMEEYGRPRNIMAATTKATVPAYTDKVRGVALEGFAYNNIQYLHSDTPDDEAVMIAEMYVRSVVEGEMLTRLGFDEAWYEAAPPHGESPEHDGVLAIAHTAAAEWMESVTMDTRLHREIEPFAKEQP